MSAAIVVGVGPGIGASVARRLAREGLDVGVLARSASTIDTALESLTGLGATAGITADVTDEVGLRVALDELVAELGVPAVVVYNAALIQRDIPGELTAREHLDAYAVNVVGAITTAAHLAPAMIDAGGGTILLTGGMPEAVPERTSLSVGKAGLRGLTEALAGAYGPAGIHVATVTVAGGPVEPGSEYDPDDIAGEYWRLHTQPPDRWEREVLYAARPAAVTPARA